MIVALSDECPLFHPPNEIYLHRFLLTIAARWHAIVSPSPERLQTILPQHVWSVYGGLLSRAYPIAVNSSQSWVSHQDCGTCDAKKISMYYSLPVLVVVENAQTDGAWLRAIADRLRPSVSRRFNGNDPMISVIQAGGIGEIPKEVRRLATRYVRLRPREDLPLRVIALADSDAKEPGGLSGSAREVEKVASEVGATAHILHKRTIENYIPDDSLLAYAELRRERRAAADQIVALSGAARDHYPIKSGLEESDLSSIYPPGITPGLGLGDFVHDLLSNLYHSITANGLRVRDGAGELDVLLDKLERNL